MGAIRPWQIGLSARMEEGEVRSEPVLPNLRRGASYPHPDRVGLLIAEYFTYGGVNGWDQSPRGKWVTYQLERYEQRTGNTTTGHL